MASFTLSDLPEDMWAEFEARAKREGRPLRSLLLALIESYVNHGLAPGMTEPGRGTAHPRGVVSFTWVCDSGHDCLLEYDRSEFAAMLAAGDLKLWCNWCGKGRFATSHEISNMRRRLGDGTL